MHDGLKPRVTWARNLDLGSGRTSFYCLYLSNVVLVKIELKSQKTTQLFSTS
ncbi:hypothetical protein HanIR_Chr14g0690831 [Helianthus annuus]|uniref:Uncharacterized protein n=1 Tax=Helianthus annuus TaxID=4232 RepID=A0A251SFB6_HELAN|nr:hypothetical protein HanIR_Chr14g0690831 [Helianthus annuus]